MTALTDDALLIDAAMLAAARVELGTSFVRILGYFREDGEKSVAAIEAGMRALNAAAIVIPAHTLKGEARQFGAERLAQAAEVIEVIARQCVENRDEPTEALAPVAGLRALFRQTMARLDGDTSPLVGRRPVVGFGRRAS